MRDLSVLPKINFVSLVDIPRVSNFANFPTYKDIFPSFRAVGFGEHTMMTILVCKNFCSEAIRMLVKPPRQTGQHSGVPNGYFLEAQAPLAFVLVRFFQLIRCIFFIRGGAPDKVSLGSVNQLMNFKGEQYELHDRSGNASKEGLCKGGSTSHIEEFCFSSRQLCVKIVQNKLVISIARFLVKNRKTKLFAKLVFRMDA